MQKKNDIKNELIDTAKRYVRDGVLNKKYSSLQDLKIAILVSLPKKQQAEIEYEVSDSEIPKSVNWVGDPLDKWRRNFFIAGATAVAVSDVNYRLNECLVLSVFMGGFSSLFAAFLLFQYDLNNARTECTNRHKRFNEIFADTRNKVNADHRVFPLHGNQFFPLQRNDNVAIFEDIDKSLSPR